MFHNMNTSIKSLVGNTPMLYLQTLSKIAGVNIYAKCEFMNPTGSIKDRIAFEMVDYAEKKNYLKPGYTIVEASAGNTGISLAMVALNRGYNLVLFVPEKISSSKAQYLKALSTNLIYLTKEQCMASPGAFIKYADEYASSHNNTWLADQFRSKINIDAHLKTTGPEIWQQMSGKLDMFVAGMGTGGTLCGAGKYLKSKDPSIKLLLTDVKGSIQADTLNKKSEIVANNYYTEGIGGNFITELTDFSLIDDAQIVTDQEVCFWCHTLLKKEGIFAGSSSGAIIASIMNYAKKNILRKNFNIVCVLPDTGANYLDTFYCNKWCKSSLGMEIDKFHEFNGIENKIESTLI